MDDDFPVTYNSGAFVDKISLCVTSDEEKLLGKGKAYFPFITA